MHPPTFLSHNIIYFSFAQNIDKLPNLQQLNLADNKLERINKISSRRSIPPSPFERGYKKMQAHPLPFKAYVIYA